MTYLEPGLRAIRGRGVGQGHNEARLVGRCVVTHCLCNTVFQAGIIIRGGPAFAEKHQTCGMSGLEQLLCRRHKDNCNAKRERGLGMRRGLDEAALHKKCD